MATITTTMANTARGIRNGDIGDNLPTAETGRASVKQPCSWKNSRFGLFQLDFELLHLLEVLHFLDAQFFVAAQFPFAKFEPTADGHHGNDHHPHSVAAQ